MASLQDMLDGKVEAVLTAHLTTTPVVQPPSLFNLVEANFRGYAPAPFVTPTRLEYSSGWGITNGTATFAYSGIDPTVSLTALYVTALFEGVVYLVVVADLVGTAGEVMAWGEQAFNVEVVSYVLPAAG